MKKIQRNIKIILIILLALFVLLAGYFSYAIFFYGDRWFSNSYNSRVRMDASQPKVIPGDILDRNNIKLATTQKTVQKDKESKEEQDYYYRSYHSNASSTAHVVGFHHPGVDRMGAEAFHIRYLMGYNNSLFERVYQKAFLPREQGNNIVLTIDSRLHYFIDKQMGSYKGSVVVLNPKTGEILAMVSHPAFDPNKIRQNAGLEDVSTDALFDRATLGLYPPGSIFKIITAASALENIEDIQQRVFNCPGLADIKGEIIPCYQQKAHGRLDIRSAFDVSCNVVFSELGIELGVSRLLASAEAFGFNDDFLFSDIKMVASRFPLNKKTSDDKLAWASIGQYEVLVSPLHMAMLAGAIANEGVMMEPKLLYKVTSRDSRVLKTLEPKIYKKSLSAENAAIIKTMMENVVSRGTGKAAQVSGLEANVAGKTGTAEKLVEGTAKNNAWFIGFAPADNPSIAIAVVLEDMEQGQTGGSKAAPLAGQIIKAALELGY